MTQYSAELKEQMVRKLMPPTSRSVAAVSRETGISQPTLYAWKKQFRDQGHLVPKKPGPPDRWDSKTKLAALIHTAVMNEAELLPAQYEKADNYRDKHREDQQ